MADDTGQDGGNPLIVIGDKIQPPPHLVALLQQLRTENNMLNPEDRIQNAVCNECSEVALALRKHLDSVKMILIGPDLAGNPMAMANKATGEFFEPIVQDYVLSGVAPSGDFESMSPKERSQLVDQRLDSVNKFPSLPEYLWQLVDFKSFFKLCYLTSLKIKSTSIAFLQQTA